MASRSCKSSFRRMRAIVVVVVLWATPATAEPAWTLTPIAGTDFPIDVDLGVQVAAPFRLRATTTLGYLPGPYVDAINTFLVDIGAYNQDVANLVKSSLTSSLVWRTHVGYQPWACHGFYAMAGYGLVTFGGGATGSEIIEAATGKQLPVTDRTMPRTLAVTSTLHMLDVELGWDWHLDDHWLVRAAGGGGVTVAAHTTETP